MFYVSDIGEYYVCILYSRKCSRSLKLLKLADLVTEKNWFCCARKESICTCVAPHEQVHSTCVHVNEIIMCYHGIVQTFQLMYDMHYAL